MSGSSKEAIRAQLTNTKTRELKSQLREWCNHGCPEVHAKLFFGSINS